MNFLKTTGITKEKVINALKSIKNGKAPGPNELPPEILRLIEEDTTHTIVELFNIIYKSHIIKIINTTRMVSIHFRNDFEKGKCETVHCRISLISHTLRTFLILLL